MKSFLKPAWIAALAAATFGFQSRGADKIFDEANGVVSFEAEHFSTRVDGTDPDGNGVPHHYHVVPDDDGKTTADHPYGDSNVTEFTNARGTHSYIVNLPDAGQNKNTGPDIVGTAPYVEYKININSPGTYRLFTRWADGSAAGASDSAYVQIMGINPAWYRISTDPDSIDFGARGGGTGWDGLGDAEVVNGNTGANPVVWNLGGGLYVLRVSQREDGAAFDAFILQKTSLAAPTGEGPAESALTTTYIQVTQAPQDTTAKPPAAATFSTSATSPSGAVSYQWQSKAPGAADFSNIAGATSASYTTGATTDAMNGTLYRAVVSVGAKSATTVSAKLTTDAVPPSVLGAVSGPSPTTVTLTFSEKVEATSAGNKANYTIAGLAVNSAAVSADGTQVSLLTAAQTAGKAYSVTVNGVKDIAGNAQSNGTAGFSGAVLVPGKLLVREFDAIGGTAVTDLTGNAKYPNRPDLIRVWDVFGPFTGDGNNYGDNFGLEITGLITPTTTADYEFYIRSDDASSLWLSTDETPANARRIAQQTGCCNAFTHQPNGLSSAPIHLEAGKSYYVKSYLKEGGGGDWIEVAWRNSVDDGDITVPPDAGSVIDGTFLSMGYDKNASLTITQSPASLTSPANSPVVFTVAYSSQNAVFGNNAAVQWQKALPGSSTFTDIPGATGPSYKITFPTAAISGSKYRAVVTVGNADLGVFQTANSDAATLTVSGETQLLAVKGLILHQFFNNVQGGSIANLRADARFPDSPTFVSTEPLFEFPPNGASSYDEAYGNRISGWFLPPETGDYVFFISSDDPGELYLSTDMDPANKHLIATETSWSNPREWVTSSNGGTDIPSKRSDQFPGTTWPTGATISLKAGTPYYIESLHVEGGGGDNVGVTYRKPSDSDDPANGTAPIAAAEIEQLFAVNGSITITQQPVGGPSPANTRVTFTVAATSADSPLLYFWERAEPGSSTFTPVPGAVKSTYTTGLIGNGDNGAKYHAVVYSSKGAAISSPAAITVTLDNIAPTITSFNGGKTSATIGFSEPVSAATAQNTANYKLSGVGSIAGATLSADGMSVKVDFAGINGGQNYTLTISGIKDPAGNTAATATEAFTAYDVFANFNGSDLPPGFSITGSAKLIPSGGYDGSGYLELTHNVNGVQGTVRVDDTTGGIDVNKLVAKFKMRIGEGSGNAADGVSFNIAGDIDPNTANVGEDGIGTGLSVNFDTYDNGGNEAPSIDIKWGGTTIATHNSASTPPVTKATLVNNRWVDVLIAMDGDPVTGIGHVNVIYDNVKYYDNLQIDGWTPITGPKIALGGRTGGENENQWVDDLAVVYNADIAVPEPPTISITSPANGTTYAAGATIIGTVDAKEKNGVITKVTWYANGNKLLDLSNPPFSIQVSTVPAGDYLVYAVATDANGVSVTSQKIRLIVGDLPSKVLFVTADPGPLTFAGDQAVLDHLVSRGITPDLSTGTALLDDGSAGQGYGMIVVSSSLGSGTVGDKLQLAPIPVMEWEASLVDNFKYQADDATKGATDSGTDINIVDAASPLAAGLSAGVHTVLTASETTSWGAPLGDVHIVATATDDPTHANIFWYEKGAKGYQDFVMPARRGFFFFQDNAARSANADAWKLFDAEFDFIRQLKAVQPPPHLNIALNGANVTVTWTNGGTLESSDKIDSGWTSTGNSSGTATTAASAAAKFYRVKR